MRRQWAAAESRSYGWGGLQAVSAAIHMSPNTIRKGLVELAWREKNPRAPVDSYLRRKGGGRKRRSEADPGLVETLEQLVEPVTRGDPETPCVGLARAHRRLAEELSRMGHPLSPGTVGRMLNADLGYSLQANRKTHEGESHPDRNAQFEYISQQVRRLQKRGQPVVSVDTKRRNWLGISRMRGRSGDPRDSRTGQSA